MLHRINTYAKANNRKREKRKITIATRDTVNDAKTLVYMRDETY